MAARNLTTELGPPSAALRLVIIFAGNHDLGATLANWSTAKLNRVDRRAVELDE